MAFNSMRFLALAGLCLLPQLGHAGYQLRTYVSGLPSSEQTVVCSDTAARFFAYTGNAQTITVPAGCTRVTIKAWGSAGGSKGGLGGAGGYVTAAYRVAAGNALTVQVGAPGELRYAGNAVRVPQTTESASQHYLAAAYLPGGGGGLVSGGGLVGVHNGSGYLVIAGSGGGGLAGGTGGGGGGLVGQSGANGVAGGYPTAGGGTQSAGGQLSSGLKCGALSPALNQGGYLTGGIASADYPGYGGIGIADDSGGGGAGYYGGAGGGHCGKPGGGGGSSFYAQDSSYLGGGEVLAAAGALPGNSGDADRAGAGEPVLDSSGRPGLVVIRFN
jgi:hypothetical protein